MNIVVCGMKHCGKSTHGEFLARKLDCPFLDTDALLEKRYLEKENNPLNSREIYNLHGEGYFRELEAEVILELIDNSVDDALQIIALGGGVPTNKKLGGRLKELGRFVYIKNKPEVIFKRIERKGLPKFLQGDDPYEKFLNMYHEREIEYIKLADLVVEFNEDTELRTAGFKILSEIEEKFNEWKHIR